ncbi:hypothetical protein F511_18489 [Dorcoceras hygrometricum]|uniref:Uncharacterized protein n=1 Tax=Dorcoceras hygrometricum TaxID=472368 RepID=A0A2Z7A4N4_9LAMI|nr:hypothetical protein F511_18489 [Dorcoceras hygrometricum]
MGIDQLKLHCPAWLPKEPAKANQDTSSPKTGKENEVKPHQSAGGNHRSVIFMSVDHHSSVVFRRDDSAGHHPDDSIGPFRKSWYLLRVNIGFCRKIPTVATSAYLEQQLVEFKQ